MLSGRSFRKLIAFQAIQTVNEMGLIEGPESLQWRNYAWYYDPETVAHEATM